jgi:hypothetical protein
LAHYFGKRIKPYLIYDGPIEVDETKVGAVNYLSATVRDEFRWVFGIICRRTKIPVSYYVTKRSRENIFGIIKQHC